MNLKALLPAGSQAKILAHLMQWFQPGSSHNQNTGVTYDSADPWTIVSQLQLAAKSGVDVFMVDWYSQLDLHGDLAFKNLLALAEFGGLPVQAGICIDKGALGKLIQANVGMTTQQAFQAAYNSVISAYSQHKAFFPDFIMEFGCGAAGVSFSAVTGVTIPIIHDDPSYGTYFTWVGMPSGAASVANHYADPNCKMGSACFGFNDGAPTNLNTSIWNTQNNVRLLDRCHTGQNWKQCWKNIPASMSHVQVVTWNDYEEGTAIEGLL